MYFSLTYHSKSSAQPPMSTPLQLVTGYSPSQLGTVKHTPWETTGLRLAAQISSSQDSGTRPVADDSLSGRLRPVAHRKLEDKEDSCGTGSVSYLNCGILGTLLTGRTRSTQT